MYDILVPAAAFAIGVVFAVPVTAWWTKKKAQALNSLAAAPTAIEQKVASSGVVSAVEKAVASKL